jgi:hypothetical protein
MLWDGFEAESEMIAGVGEREGGCCVPLVTVSQACLALAHHPVTHLLGLVTLNVLPGRTESKQTKSWNCDMLARIKTMLVLQNL